MHLPHAILEHLRTGLGAAALIAVAVPAAGCASADRPVTQSPFAGMGPRANPRAPTTPVVAPRPIAQPIAPVVPIAMPPAPPPPQRWECGPCGMG